MTAHYHDVIVIAHAQMVIYKNEVYSGIVRVIIFFFHLSLLILFILHIILLFILFTLAAHTQTLFYTYTNDVDIYV